MGLGAGRLRDLPGRLAQEPGVQTALNVRPSGTRDMPESPEAAGPKPGPKHTTAPCGHKQESVGQGRWGAGMGSRKHPMAGRGRQSPRTPKRQALELRQRRREGAKASRGSQRSSQQQLGCLPRGLWAPQTVRTQHSRWQRRRRSIQRLVTALSKLFKSRPVVLTK